MNRSTKIEIRSISMDYNSNIAIKHVIIFQLKI